MADHRRSECCLFPDQEEVVSADGAAMPHARNTLGMRAEGSTGSADCAGEILDMIDKPTDQWPKPPTGYPLDGMVSEAAIASGSAPTGLQTLMSLADDAFLWGSDRR